jgi:hypothetical protein
MIGPIRTGWCARLILTGSAAALALIALAALSPPAQARVWVSVGVPCCGYYYGPGPYYGYAPPYYQPYAPPPYPAPYPAPQGYYPPPGAPAPSAYAPPAGAPPSATAAPASGVAYTSKPAFTNAAGQTCREYKTTDTTEAHPVDVYGTACKQADGQWRVVN